MIHLITIKVNEIKERAEKKDIYIENGFIASTGFIDIKEEDIIRLKKWDIDEVHVEDSSIVSVDTAAAADFDKFLREYKVFKKIYFNSLKKVKSNLSNYKNNNILNMNELNGVIDETLDIINRNLYSVLELLNINNIDKNDSYYLRSLNVSLISMIMAKSMKLPEEKIKKLGIGALLYDIGLTKVPDKIINKVGKFTQEEYAEVKKHTVYGYKIMKTNFRFEDDLTMIPLAHHEHFNGKGYPRNLAGANIHLYAKMVFVAHSVEKMMKDYRYVNKPKDKETKSITFNLMLEKATENKKLLDLSDAVREIIHGANTKYDPNVSKIFAGILTIYPVGCIVILNDKRKGLVFAVNSSFPIRPIIKMVSNENGEFIEDGEVINLLETNQLFIVGVDKEPQFLEEVRTKIFESEEEKQ